MRLSSKSSTNQGQRHRKIRRGATRSSACSHMPRSESRQTIRSSSQARRQGMRLLSSQTRRAQSAIKTTYLLINCCTSTTRSTRRHQGHSLSRTSTPSRVRSRCSSMGIITCLITRIKGRSWRLLEPPRLATQAAV